MPDCCRCKERGIYAVRVAIPIKGSRIIDRWVYTGDYACEAHRKTLRAADVLPESEKPHIIAAMEAKGGPDFERAFLEWMRV